jgi:Ca2+-binding EF-hand superfamily protein
MLEQLFALFDPTESGLVDYRGFHAGLILLSRGKRDDKVRQAFAAFDEDRDGTLLTPF